MKIKLPIAVLDYNPNYKYSWFPTDVNDLRN